MKCNKCGHILPEDSVFCQYCGSRIEWVIKENENTSTTTATTKSANPITENNITKNPTAPKINHTSLPKTTNAPKVKKTCVAVIVLAVLLFISLVLNAFQFGVNIQNQNNIAALDEQLLDSQKTILNKTNTIATLEEKISEQKNEISSLEFRSRAYGSIISNMRFGNSGYAASNFYATDSVIVVGKNETDRKFRLYASWSNGGTVNVDYSSNSAWLSFDDEEWYSWTDMTVHPSAKGVTVATFSNTVNSDTFKVLIIVTD